MATVLGTVGLQLLDRLFVRGTVLETESVTPRLRRIRIGAPALAQLPYQPGQQVRVQVGGWFGRDLLKGDTLRTYSIWRHGSTQGWLDLCVLDQPNAGPGARWGTSVTPGTSVAIRPPEGKFVLRSHAGMHLLVGDETASVALSAIANALPMHARIVSVIETESERERLPFPSRTQAEWVARGTRPTGETTALVAATRRVAQSLPADGPRSAYIAGEAKACKAARAVLVSELGWSSRDVLLKPFWLPGKNGLE